MYFLDQTDKRHLKKRIEIRARAQMLILEFLKSKERSCFCAYPGAFVLPFFLLSVVGLRHCLWKFTLLLCVLSSVYFLCCFCCFLIHLPNRNHTGTQLFFYSIFSL